MKDKPSVIPPHCKNKIADWIYKQMTHRLKHRIKKIILVKNLSDPDIKGRKLCGFLVDNEICIDSGMCRKEKIKTLIHELAHSIWDDAKEMDVWKIEGLLYQAFSKAQKDILWRHIKTAHMGKIPRK